MLMDQLGIESEAEWAAHASAALDGFEEVLPDLEGRNSQVRGFLSMLQFLVEPMTTSEVRLPKDLCKVRSSLARRLQEFLPDLESRSSQVGSLLCFTISG